MNTWMINTGCDASSSITSSELLDLITTTQWKSSELMPRPEVNLRTSSYGSPYDFSKCTPARCRRGFLLTGEDFDRFVRLHIFWLCKKWCRCWQGKHSASDKWLQLICYPRSQKVPFSYLFTNLLLFTKFSLDVSFICVKSLWFLKCPWSVVFFNKASFSWLRLSENSKW